jgi:iron complex outermembrane receptor protein
MALSVLPAAAQTSGGKITGTVRDATGAPLPGVTVTILNQETGASRVIRTLAAGTYESADLTPGVYTVTADMPGFRRVLQRNQTLAPGASLVINFALEVRITEAVTVTAMKREETVQSTPVSITAPTEEVLRERGVDNIEGVSANVPNFIVQNLGPGQSSVAMRGVSSGQIARDQPGVKEQVGAYLDESVISLSLFTPDIDLFDMNRVEVLRGPQGTLFGSGSEGGTVRYITNAPQIGVTSVFGEVGGAAIDGGGTGGNAKAGFNVPLGSGVALRGDAYYNRLAGWMDEVHPLGFERPGEFTLEKNTNTGDREGARLAFAIAPDDRLTVIPRFIYQKVAMEGWNRVDKYNILGNPFTTTRPKLTVGDTEMLTQLDEPFTDKFTLGDLNVKYNFGNVLLTSITSFTNRSILVTRDATALTASVTGGTLGKYGVTEDVYTLNAPLYDATQAHGWTQEVRASSSNPKDRFQWVFGGFYADSHRAYQQTLPVRGFDALCTLKCSALVPTKGVYAPTDFLYWSDIRYDDRQWAFFGEGTFAFTSWFSLTGGLRYYNYTQDKTLIFDGLFAPDFPAPTLGPGSVDADGVAPRVIASFKVTDSTTINAQASKGFRLGGVNDPILKPLCSPSDLVTFGGVETWKDETAWNYEIGSKTTFLGGRAALNAAAFYVDISDLQVVVTAGTCSSRLVFNVPKSRSVGGELEFSMTPNEHFDFSFSGSYADATVRESLSGSEDTITATGIREGNRLPSVPKFQMALTATYQQDVLQGFRGYVTGNYQHVGSRYTQLGDQEPGVGTINLLALPTTIGGPLTQNTFTFDPLLPAYDILNLRLGLRHNNWDVAFYVNNITDEQALLAIDRERGFLARQGFLTNQPRTFGLSSRVDF